MKILHVTEAWNGGISTYINMLVRYHGSEHDLVILYDPALAHHSFDPVFFEAMGVELIPYNSTRNPLKIFKTSKSVNSHIKAVHPDIVHLHSSFPGVYGRLLSHNIPVVYCAHGWAFSKAKHTNGLKPYLYGLIERHLAKRAKAIINISDFEHKEAKRVGITAPLHVTIPNGVEDIDAFHTGESLTILSDHIAQVLKRLDTTEFHLGFVGRLDHNKGYDILLDYVANCHRNDIQLSIIGDSVNTIPDHYADLLEHSPNIKSCGWITPNNIDAYYQQFDLLIVPSRQEGFGLVVIEAMRNGVPAVVSSHTGMQDLVKHGYNGFIINLDHFMEDMNEILSNTDRIKLAEMGRNARHVYEKNYTASRMGSDVLDLYTRVLDYASNVALDEDEDEDASAPSPSPEEVDDAGISS